MCVSVPPGTNVCVPLQRRVPLRHVRDAGDRAGNPCGGQVLHPFQAGPVRRAGLHLRTPEVSPTPPAAHVVARFLLVWADVMTWLFSQIQGQPVHSGRWIWVQVGHGGRDGLLHLLLGSGEGGAERGGHHFQHSANWREVAVPPVTGRFRMFHRIFTRGTHLLSSLPDFPAEGKRRCPSPCPNRTRPGRSSQTRRPFPRTCFSAGRATRRCSNAHV